jgi:hypothetical protein
LIIPGADHTFGAMHPLPKNTIPETLLEFCDKTIDFLKK